MAGNPETGTVLFLLLRGVCYSEPGNRSCQETRWTTESQHAPANSEEVWEKATSFCFLSLKKKQKQKQSPTMVVLWYKELIRSWSSNCYLVSFLLIYFLTFEIFWQIKKAKKTTTKKTTQHLHNNVLIYLLLQAKAKMLFWGFFLPTLGYYLIRALHSVCSGVLGLRHKNGGKCVDDWFSDDVGGRAAFPSVSVCGNLIGAFAFIRY